MPEKSHLHEDDSAVVSTGGDIEDFPVEAEDILAPPAPPAAEEKIIISPRLVALVASLVAVAAATSLAFVASAHDADTLSTLALALAILSLGVQLIAAAAQNQQSSQQSLRSEQLNTQTRALLTEIQTAARGTERMLREQFGQVLRAFMDAAAGAQKGKDFDPDAFEQRLMSNMRREAQVSRADAPLSSAQLDRERRIVLRQREERAKQAAELRQAQENASGPFPEEAEAAPVLGDLQALSEEARIRLRGFGIDKAHAALTSDSSSGRIEGYRIDSAMPEDADLLRHGFIRAVQLPPPSDAVVYQLTDKGDLGARILNAAGPVPPWVEGLLVPAPNMLADEYK